MVGSSWSFDLTNFDSVWKVMVQIGILLIGLLIGNLLRNVIPFLKKGLVPSALIGGLIILIVHIILKQCNVTWYGTTGLVDQQIMQVITYHGLGIGFVAMTLKTTRAKNRTAKRKIVENGALTGGTYMLQGVLGIAVSVIFFLCSSNMFAGAGLLLPLGFGQGPGNALAWDVKFSELVDEAGNQLFTGNGSVGLTIASVGFIVASVIGVIYINIFKKKGKIVIEGSEAARAKTVAMFEADNEIPDTESIDKFTIQLALVFLAYAAAFGIMCLFKLNDFTNGIAWGFNFIWGVITASLIKLVLRGLKKAKVVKREYINNYQMDRISGFAFDMMIVAGVAAIEIEAVAKYLWLIIALCLVGLVGTYVYIRLITKHCFKGYEHEMFVTNFGALTGTASNGMILLKEIDPNFRTPAANLYVTSQLPAMIFVAPMLLLLNFAVKNMTNLYITWGIFFALFVAYTTYLIISGKKKDNYQREETTPPAEATLTQE